MNKKQAVLSTGAPAPIGPYSQAIVVQNIVFVSGQIPMHHDTGAIVSGNIEAATHLVMQNVGAVLKQAGCTFNDVVKASIFVKSMDDFSRINAVYGSYFSEPFPARETVEVSRLPKDVEVEISVVAIKP